MPPPRTVPEWPAQPVIHEVNTWAWLAELAAAFDRPVDLATVPAQAWDDLVMPGIDAVWLMGVWERSPRGVAVARQHPGVAADHRAALPDFTDDDVVGSPYCIRSYTVDAHLGGDEALAVARQELARRGARLLLDYVPNHVAQDHPWVGEQPELFIHGTAQEAQERPREFVAFGDQVVALGRDPHFEPWQDVCQLNAFSEALRRQTAQTLANIAQRADGVRCDMAMLVVNEVFARTWGERAGPRPDAEFWPAIIDGVRATAPDFLFLAEVYWDMEAVLLEQGFDYCYDKRLYDRLADGDVAGLTTHLGGADAAHQRRLVRFLENHDEPRAAAALPADRWRAAAVVALTLPGAVLLYEGQLDGRTVRPPVALGRRPAEHPDRPLRAFYAALLAVVHDTALRDGEWVLHDVDDHPHKEGVQSLLAWSWSRAGFRYLVVVNLTAQRAQGRVRVAWQDVARHTVELVDRVRNERFERIGDELLEHGLDVDLPAGGFQLLTVSAH